MVPRSVWLFHTLLGLLWLLLHCGFTLLLRLYLPTPLLFYTFLVPVLASPDAERESGTRGVCGGPITAHLHDGHFHSMPGVCTLTEDTCHCHLHGCEGRLERDLGRALPGTATLHAMRGEIPASASALAQGSQHWHRSVSSSLIPQLAARLRIPPSSIRFQGHQAQGAGICGQPVTASLHAVHTHRVSDPCSQAEDAAKHTC